MAYDVGGRSHACDDEGYLLEATFDDEVSRAIAAAEGVELTDLHWEVIRHLRDVYGAEGQSPNFRNLLKGVQAFRPEADSKSLYDLFPMGPAKQGAKIAGLPRPHGKGGY